MPDEHHWHVRTAQRGQDDLGIFANPEPAIALARELWDAGENPRIEPCDAGCEDEPEFISA